MFVDKSMILRVDSPMERLEFWLQKYKQHHQEQD